MNANEDSMDLSNLKYAEGSKKKRKRVGRGPGSGHGKTSCRGHKGQGARSGAKSRAWFEGGQMPLQRRIPKRGFTNLFGTEYLVINVGELNRIDGGKVDPEIMRQFRLIRTREALVKILGGGELTKSIEVSAHAFSKSAREKIEAAGGKAIQL